MGIETENFGLAVRYSTWVYWLSRWVFRGEGVVALAGLVVSCSELSGSSSIAGKPFCDMFFAHRAVAILGDSWPPPLEHHFLCDAVR